MTPLQATACNLQETNAVIRKTVFTCLFLSLSFVAQASESADKAQAEQLAFCAGIAELTPRGQLQEIDSFQLSDQAAKALAAHYSDAPGRVEQLKREAQNLLYVAVADPQEGVALAARVWQKHCQLI